MLHNVDDKPDSLSSMQSATRAYDNSSLFGDRF